MSHDRLRRAAACVPASVRRYGEGRGCVPDEANKEGSGSHTIDYV